MSDDDDPICERCNLDFVATEYERTKYCHSCAHEIAESAEAELAALQGTVDGAAIRIADLDKENAALSARLAEAERLIRLIFSGAPNATWWENARKLLEEAK